MPAKSQEPAYNLKVVVQETGLKPDTLRAWERRYGLPQPERTAGGHRLYSQRDIDTLKWLVARQEEGMSISRAVELWARLTEEGQDPLRSTQFASMQPVEVIMAAPDLTENSRNFPPSFSLIRHTPRPDILMLPSMFPPSPLLTTTGTRLSGKKTGSMSRTIQHPGMSRIQSSPWVTGNFPLPARSS